MSVNTRRPSWWLVAFGGVLTALAFPLQPIPYLPPISLWPIIFISLSPFLARLLASDSISDATKTSLMFAIPWIFVAGVWVFRMFDALGLVLIWLPILAVVLFTLAAHVVRRSGFSVIWTWPIVWLAVEYIRSEWTPLRFNWLSKDLDPLNFTWFGLGHPRLIWPPAAQSADLIGGYGLAITPFLTNLLLASVWTNRLRASRSVVVFVLLFGMCDAGYCAWRWQLQSDANPIPVGVVQSERYELPVLMELTDTLLGAAPETKLVVWPELAFSMKPGDQEQVHEFARRRGITLVTGVEIPTDGGYRNRAWWLPPEGPIGEYAKQNRVPFVERHAASEICSTFTFNSGHQSVQVGILICYDIDFARPARRLVSECAAELIALPTLDDITWGGTQHAQHSLLPRLRAIENRRPIVQASTSGVSQILDHRGWPMAGVPFRIHPRPDRPTTYLEGFAFAHVFPSKFASFYTANGHLVMPVVTGISAILIFSAICWRWLAGFRRAADFRG